MELYSSDRRRQHNQTVWEKFWEKQDIAAVYPNSDRIIQQMRELGSLQNKWVMEIGAGSGRDGFHLAAQGARMIFLDYAENSLKLISALAQQNATKVYLVRADAFHLPFKTLSLDLVYHQGLLEHFKDCSGIVRENYRVLKSGGFALADVPQRYHFYTLVKHILIALNKWFAGWETEFSIRQLMRLYQHAGFSIHHAYGDWMRPSFLYRMIREVCKKFSWVLPLYPKNLPILHSWRRYLRVKIKRLPIAFNTFMDIGVIAKKAD